MAYNQELPFQIIYKKIIDDRPEYIQVTQGSYGYIVLDGITWGLIEDDGLATTDRQVIDVMEAGSMFGWDIPLVNNYRKGIEHGKTN